MTKLRLPRGVRDILPAEAARWRQLETVFADCCEPAGYGELRTPMFEDLEVFKRLGEQTEVVTKEMYDFIDKGGNHIALRPEMTASAARAFMQHNPPVPWKIYYLGPQFRYERPQAGRYRQFSQAGIEVFGVSDPHLDVEVMALGWQFLQALGLRQLTLLINSLGDAAGRERYGEQLSQYWQARHGDLSEASQATAQTNPLRVLDSKRAEDQAVIAEAPSCLEALSPADAERFEVVRAGLDALEIPYQGHPPAGARGSTTTPRQPLSMYQMPWKVPRMRWAAADTTAGWCRSWAAAMCPGWVLPWASTGSCWLAIPRKCLICLPALWMCLWWTLWVGERLWRSLSSFAQPA